MSTIMSLPAVQPPRPIPLEWDGAVRQGALTVITPILPGQTESLRELLDRIDRDPERGTDVETNPYIPFPELTRVHFARWLIFDETHDLNGRVIPASLVFSSNFDGPLEEHLDELIAVAGPGLDGIYRHCEGYPAAGHAEPGAVAAYLRAHRLRVNTFYNGTYGKSVGQIRREAALREAIGDFLDEHTATAAGANQDAAGLRAAVQSFVRGRPDLSWALRPPRPTRPPFPGGAPARVIGIVLVVLMAAALIADWQRTLVGIAAVLVPLALVVGLWFLAVRWRESQEDGQAWTEKHRPKTPELAEREDRVVQNQLSSVILIKPGRIRAATLRTVLAAIDTLARYVFYKGSLGSIPSIHFARWVIVDDGRRLAFFSNFDGSWESYLGEFVDRASSGLTAVWSNCVEFPRTRWLLREGAAHEQAFKSYARDKQVITNVWYSAYKTLTVQNITNNSEVRRGLIGRMSGAQLTRWLRRL
jgi:hypothetical protein